jgi:Kef-type K+ transport system membrane component KefB
MLWDLPSFDVTRLMQWNASLLFGGLLLFGLIGGHIVSKNLWFPRLIGYLLIGFALGKNGLNWLSGDVLTLASSFADVALALMVYQLGRYVDIGWLRYEKWLAATVVSGAILCFTLVWLSLEWLGISRPAAMLTAVLAIGTAPAVIMVVIRELNATAPGYDYGAEQHDYLAGGLRSASHRRIRGHGPG